MREAALLKFPVRSTGICRLVWALDIMFSYCPWAWRAVSPEKYNQRANLTPALLTPSGFIATLKVSPQAHKGPRWWKLASRGSLGFTAAQAPNPSSKTSTAVTGKGTNKPFSWLLFGSGEISLSGADFSVNNTASVPRHGLYHHVQNWWQHWLQLIHPAPQNNLQFYNLYMCTQTSHTTLCRCKAA